MKKINTKDIMKNLINRALAAEKKKLFCLLAIMAATTFTAYSSGDSSTNQSQSIDVLPSEMQEFVYDLRRMIIYKLDSRETPFHDIVVEGRNVVCRFVFDEAETGKLLKDGLHRDLSDDDIRYEFIRRINKQCEYTVDALRKYKYNIVVRFTGSKSKYVKDIKILYKEF